MHPKGSSAFICLDARRQRIPLHLLLAKLLKRTFLLFLAVFAVLCSASRVRAAAGSFVRVLQPSAPAAPKTATAWQSSAQQSDPLPIVVGYEVRGNQRYRAEQLWAVLGQRVGEKLDPERIERGIDSLWSAYRVRAEVAVAEEADGVLVRLDVLELPLDFAPRFVGNERVSKERLLEWAGLEEDSELYLFQAKSVARRIAAEYKKRGNAFVEVRAVTREPETIELSGPDGAQADEAQANGAQDVIFEIQEGPRVKVREVIVEGNEALPNRGWWLWKSGLRKQARPKLREPWGFGLFPKYFDADVLDRDLVAYAQAYRDAGYLDAVVKLRELEFDLDRNWVTIHIVVDQGPLYTVSNVRLEGIGYEAGPDGALTTVPIELAIDEPELLAEFLVQTGQPYSSELVALDENLLRRRFGKLGFIEHESIPRSERFEVQDTELIYALDEPRVEVIYRVAQGTVQRIREVRFAGNARTQDRVLRREISVFPGDAADLVEIERSLARLRGTGYFSSLGLNPNHPEPTYRFVPTAEPGWKDLEYVVETGDSLRIDLGVQYGSDNGFAGQIGFTFQNFDIARWPSLAHPFEDIYQGRAWRGAGQTFEVSASPGTDFSRYSVRFTEPDLFRDHLERIGLTVDLNRRLRGFRTHDEKRDAVGLSLFKQLDPDTIASIGWERASILVDDLFLGGPASLIDPLSVPDLVLEQEGESDLSGFEARLRRSKLDNRLSPREGYSWSMGSTVYADWIGSDYEYVSLDANAEMYGWLNETSNANYHLRLQSGVGLPYGDTDDVPFTERYFLGGSRILRGFDFRGIGPNQRGFAIGGETMLAGSMELLWPLATQSRVGQERPSEIFRWGVFLDAGLLDPDSFQLDLGDTRASVGFTLQMRVPLPIAFNFGFPIRDEPGDEQRTFSFAISG